MFQLPKLSYSYDALEPYIDAKTMEIHHTRHHAAYIEKLNKALEGHLSFRDKSLKDLLMNLNGLPDEICTAVRNHGGGHFNHSLFWEIMNPPVGGRAEVKGKLATALKKKFEEFKIFQEEFNKKATGLFGSGWAWLIVDKERELTIVSTQNQDSPIMEGFSPILGLDVWEHAYYLKYQNKRADYVAAWWNVVNWERVENLYEEAIK